jgi:hypothetical protein
MRRSASARGGIRHRHVRRRFELVRPGLDAGECHAGARPTDPRRLSVEQTSAPDIASTIGPIDAASGRLPPLPLYPALSQLNLRLRSWKRGLVARRCRTTCRMPSPATSPDRASTGSTASASGARGRRTVGLSWHSRVAARIRGAGPAGVTGWTAAHPLRRDRAGPEDHPGRCGCADHLSAQPPPDAVTSAVTRSR